jgi:uncharacterized protein (TIGR00251 family)
MYASPYSKGTMLRVWIQPKAAKTKIVGVHGDSIKIAVKAPPVGGKANDECVKFLADLLRLPKSVFIIKNGLHGRHKGIYIEGVTPERIVSELESAIE